MAKKFYAVKKGKKIGLFDNWKETQQSILGFSNAEYKGFNDLESAKEYLYPNYKRKDISTEPKDYTHNHVNSNSKPKSQGYNNETIIAYVDGSKRKGIKGYGSGIAFLNNNGYLVKTMSFKGQDPIFLKSLQIAGELNATIEAIKWGIANRYKNIIIRYDYMGIQKWARKEWKHNAEVSKHYVEQYDALSELINVGFEKVKAHSDNTYNDLVDSLAKGSLELNDIKEE